MPEPMIVVLVHGWSSRHTDTYGKLAARLKAESPLPGGVAIDVRNIWLSKYVSFKDEVRIEDVSRAMEAALRRELGTELGAGRRFACITHSTGGPVARDWWKRYYLDEKRPCPMSHLVMLAPANFGSALAQLGKGRLSRISAWFEGVEPGQGVLDWLELGSSEAWELNCHWIADRHDHTQGPSPVFPFVLAGQTVDTKLYDHVNSYTGELGSDGVVRVAAANLNATYIRLVQDGRSKQLKRDDDRTATARASSFALIGGKSHSGKDKGILRSIKNDGQAHPTLAAIRKCLSVRTAAAYETQRVAFLSHNETIRKKEIVARKPTFFRSGKFRDPHSMVIVRLRDHMGHPIPDFDLIMTGTGDDPDRLPDGFFVDRQRNSRDVSTLTYFVNHARLAGYPRILDTDKKTELRDKLPGVQNFGIRIKSRPTKGFVHYREAVLGAEKEVLTQFLKPDQTTLVDIVLRRVVRRGVFELTNSDDVGRKGQDFTDQAEGPPIP